MSHFTIPTPSHDSHKLYFSWCFPDVPLIHWRKSKATSVTEAALEWARWADIALPGISDIMLPCCPPALILYGISDEVMEDVEKHGNIKPIECVLEKWGTE